LRSHVNIVDDLGDISDSVAGTVLTQRRLLDVFTIPSLVVTDWSSSLIGQNRSLSFYPWIDERLSQVH
jgi:hypothetical protein